MIQLAAKRGKHCALCASLRKVPRDRLTGFIDVEQTPALARRYRHLYAKRQQGYGLCLQIAAKMLLTT